MNRKSIVTSVILSFSVACVSPEAATQQEGSFGVPLPENSQIVMISGKDSPPIFSFLLESDFVAIALSDKSGPVGLKVKRVPFNSADWMKGSLNSFQIEELLFDKERFLASEPLSSSMRRTFETFRVRDLKVVFLKHHRYLLFLKEIPKEEEIFAKLDLDPSKTYYRAYEGTTTIFPVSGPRDHGTYNVGYIDLGTGKHSKVVEAIRQLGEALSPGLKKERIANLQRLTTSDNEILRENAEYAIGYLQKWETSIIE